MAGLSRTMKKIYSIIIILMTVVATALVSSCNTPEPHKEEAGVEVLVKSSTYDNIIIETTQKGNTDLYAIYLMKTEVYYNDFSSLPEKAAEWIISNEINKLANLEPNDKILFSGNKTIELGSITEVEASLSYHIIGFALKDGKVTGDVSTVIAETTELPNRVSSVVVSEVTIDNARIQVDAGKFAENYYIAPFTTEGFEEEYNSDYRKVAETILAYEKEFGRTSFNVDGKTIFNGDADFYLYESGWMIRANTEYFIVAFAVSKEGELVGEVVNSEIFKTESFYDMSFLIDITDVTDNTAKVIVTPSDPERTFFFHIIEKGIIADKTPDEAIENFMNFYGASMEQYVYAGQNTFTVRELKPGREYLVYVVGYSPIHYVTSTVFSDKFTTTGDATPYLEVPTSITIPNVDFGTLEITEIGSNHCNFTSTPNDLNMKYILMARPTEEFENYKSDEDLMIANLEFYRDFGFTILTSFEDILPEVTFRGSSSSTFAELKPSTHYTVLAYGIDVTTGQPLTSILRTTFETK